MEYKWIRRSALIFFLVTSFFAMTWRVHWNSPDETANAFFIRQYVQTGSFRAAEPLNVVGENLVHPRAVQIARHDLVPGSFLGMLIFYGWIANILGVWIVPLLTPLIATIASLFFYKLITRLFDERIARWSFFLLLMQPAWVYYTARSFFPNVLFLSLLIIGCYYIVNGQGASVRNFFLSGLFIGAALAVRTAEVGWVMGALALLLYFEKKRVTWQQVSSLAIGIVIPFLFIFYHNTALYGNPLYSGYAQIDAEAVPAAFAWHFRSRLLSTLFSLLLPFGIKPAALFLNTYTYLLWMFWWFAVPMIFGYFLLRRVHVQRRYRFVFLFLCAWLLLYYGSWSFKDTTLAGPTLGTSYVRYWLPIFVFGLPFSVVALMHVRHLWLRHVLIGGIVLLSAGSVFWWSDESLFSLRTTAARATAITRAVLDRTPSSAVIVTERSDKLFFPDRRVIFNDPLDTVKMDRVIAKLQERVPVYYFTELQQHDIDFMNENRLLRYGVAWKEREEVGGQRLYTLRKI